MPPERIDSLDAESLKGLVLSLVARIDELVKQNNSLLARIDELLEQNKTLQARITELETRSGKPPKTPTNSSLPPSSGQKANVVDAPTAKKSRKGRPGVTRELCTNPDATRDIFAERCDCGGKVPQKGQVIAHAYDHVEIPPIKPFTTRINLHSGDCSCCGKAVTAAPPVDMPPGSPFGPGIVALVTYLHGCQMVSYARLAEMLDGARPEVWISDRLAAQCNHAEQHQFCLSHLTRDAQYAVDAGDSVFAPPFKAFLKRACEIGRRRPNLADSTIKAHARTLERELDSLLDLKPTDAEGRHLRDAIIVDARDKLLVFMTRRDVEPTNNASERTLRPSVIFRKVTNCFRSEWGAKVYADICSIVSTGRLHGRTPLAAIRAALTGRTEPATP